jgi:hypothetical protein
MPKQWIWLDKELYAQLALLAKQHNMGLQSYIKAVLKRHVASPSEHLLSDISIADGGITTSPSERVADPPEGKRVSLDELVQRVADLLEKRLSRKIQDQLNAFTSRVEQVAQRQAEIVERLDALEERVKKLEESATTKEQTSEAPEKQPKKGAKREKPSVCEILDKQLVLFESDVAEKGSVKNRDRYFAAIVSQCGDVVVECAKERIAVEKNFWSQFLDKLSKIDTNNDDKIKKQLDSLELKLFKALKESALIIYDTNEKRWKPVASITASTSNTTSIDSTESSASQYHNKGEVVGE